jgi:predicted acyl esterase
MQYGFGVVQNGVETRVAKGYLKASHRATDPKKSKPYAPYHLHTREAVQPIKPGEILEYNVDLKIISNVFKAGHQIKLSIESLESPRDPELQIHYHPILNHSKSILHKIYRNKEYQSHLMLPIVLGKREVSEERELPATMQDDNCLLLSEYNVYGPPFKGEAGVDL